MKGPHEYTQIPMTQHGYRATLMNQMERFNPIEIHIRIYESEQSEASLKGITHKKT